MRDDAEARPFSHIPQGRTHTIRVQLLLTLLAVVIITAVAAWIPESWLIRREFERQTWAQVEQGRRAARTLYNTWGSEITNVALLTAQLPTLKTLLTAGRHAELAAYLETVETSLDMDLVLACDASGSVVAQIGDVALPEPCALPEPTGFYVLPEPPRDNPWLLAYRPVLDQGDDVGRVVVGIRLDERFATQMRGATELQHTLVVDETPVATSFEAGLATRSNAEVDRIGADAPPRLTFTTDDGRTFYAARLTLDNPRIVDEVALSATDIIETQRNLIQTGVLSIAAAVLIGSLIGLYMSRRISNPLLTLDQAAVRIRRGDLDSAIEVNTGIQEVARVANSLEHMRVRLGETLTSLQQEKAWGEHLLQAIVEGIVILDEQNRIRFFSEGATRITGWSGADVAAHHCDEVFRPYEQDTPFSRLIPPPGQRRTVWVTLADKQPAALSITHARLLPPQADSAQVALVFRDVSEEVAVQRLLSNFLGNVTHEFRTPLTALAASVELMLDQSETLTDDELEQMLDWLRLGILGLQTLVENLLETASLEAGHFTISPRPADLGEIVEEAIRLLRPLLQKYQQRLVVDVPPQVELLVQADERRIVQVLVNLLSNANKYAPAGSTIAVRVRTGDGQVRVEVADEGPGVPAGYESALFRRFLHLDAASDKKRAGVGLGLWVVKATVEEHGGAVGVEPRPGGGSIFWFTLPVAERV